MATRKKNPQDATLRNVRAAMKRIAVLERRVRSLELWRMRQLKR